MDRLVTVCILTLVWGAWTAGSQVLSSDAVVSQIHMLLEV
jgi:hypothetical protein